MSRFSGYDEEMNINLFDDDGVYASGDKIKKYISKMEDKDKENFVIVKSKLLYIGTDELELEAAKRLGLGSNGDSSDSQAAIKELQAIISGVVELNDKFEDTSINENKDTKNGFIGTKLVKRESKSLLDGTWNIVIEYDKENKETARYEEGYYWLKKGETYKIGEEELLFKNDYVIDYKNKEYQILSGRAVNWNEKATLGVSENIALNLDPISFASGRWEESNETDEVNNQKFENFIVKDTDGEDINTGIQKVGDVKYNNEIKALEFNEDTVNNPDGEGGYLKLSKSGLDFLNGFTFEMYCNLSRFSYYNDSEYERNGFFCRMPNLKAKFYDAMRFGQADEDIVAKFCQAKGFEYEGTARTDGGGALWCKNSFKVGEEFYLTVVYNNYKNILDTDRDCEFMKDNKVDKISFYANGVELGYTFLKNQSFNDGAEIWNTDSCPFFVGVCPWNYDGSLFFLKGSVYATRLYTSSLTSDEVKLNYDMTLKYRDSFKDEKF